MASHRNAALLSAGVLFYCINFRGRRPSVATIKRSKEGLAFISEKKKKLIEYLPLRNLGFSESAERKNKGKRRLEIKARDSMKKARRSVISML